MLFLIIVYAFVLLIAFYVLFGVSSIYAGTILAGIACILVCITSMVFFNWVRKTNKTFMNLDKKIDDLSKATKKSLSSESSNTFKGPKILKPTVTKEIS